MGNKGFLSLAFLSTMLMIMATISTASLHVGYYHWSCPAAESIVRKVVTKAVAKNPGIAAGLIRLHFHDCFVRGCDASVLLDSTIGKPAEKQSPANNPSLRGFEVIDKIKKKIEARCPKTVSCADILAFAARDSALRVGRIDYKVPAGRRDGKISLEAEASQNLPAPTLNANQLQQAFAGKGLSLDEMVTLSGAHSIGVAHCSSFSSRLYSFNATNIQDPTLNPRYAASLKTKCPFNEKNQGIVVPLDSVSPNRLDNRYYKNLRNHKGLLTSDQTLWTDPSTSPIVKQNANNRHKWAAKYAAAMVHMGSIEVLTGSQGQVRKNCRVVN